MKKRVILSLMAIFLLVFIMITCYTHISERPANWTHKTFHGTVADIWEDTNGRYFTLSTHYLKSEHNFVISNETIYAIEFEVGDEVIVESDYDMSYHNGDDIPYPAVMIADPDVFDGE